MLSTSTTIEKIAPALALAQAKINAAGKDSKNPHFNSKYADLASVWEAFRAPFAEQSLAVLQAPAIDGNHVKLTTRILHASGEWVEGSIEATARDATPQSIGSCVTYLRRYGASALIGIVSEDDDGNAAQGDGTQRRTAPVRTEYRAERRAPEPVNEDAEPVDGVIDHNPTLTPQEQEVADKLAYDEMGKQIVSLYGKPIGTALYFGATGADWGTRRGKMKAALEALAHIIHTMGERGNDVIEHTMSELPDAQASKDVMRAACEKVYAKVIGTGTVKKGV